MEQPLEGDEMVRESNHIPRNSVLIGAGIKLFLIIVAYCIVSDNLRQVAFLGNSPEKTLDKYANLSNNGFPLGRKSYACFIIGRVYKLPENFLLFMANSSTAFKVINVRNCPYYGVDDWFVLNNQSLKVPDGLPSCLILVREFTNILFAISSGPSPEGHKDVYTCGGCTGLVKFRIDALPAEVPKLNRDSSDPGMAGPREDIVGKEKKSGGAVSGSLEEISPSELLQFFHMHQKTGKLLLEMRDGTARVAFREGAIIGARYAELEDKNAIFSILGQNRGKFSFVTGIPETLKEVDNIGDFMMILMEGLKRLDEAAEQKE